MSTTLLFGTVGLFCYTMIPAELRDLEQLQHDLEIITIIGIYSTKKKEPIIGTRSQKASPVSSATSAQS